MPNLPESILARIAGSDRAAAIYGDLNEMAATRTRLWFWMAYIRTLVTLGWRTPVALLCAYGFSSWIAIAGFPTIRSIFRIILGARPRPTIAWHDAFWHRPLGDSLLALWFILPFVVVRFGLRDRIAQLTCAIFLLTLPYFRLSPAAVNFAGSVVLGVFLASVCFKTWRRPMIVLAASVAPIAMATVYSRNIWYVLTSRGYGFASPQLQWAMALYRALELCIAAMVCLFLYRRLLQEKPADRGSIA